MTIGRDLITSLGIDIHGAGKTILRDDAAIPLCGIDFTKNDVFVLTQYNAPFDSETKWIKRIINDKYKNADLEATA